MNFKNYRINLKPIILIGIVLNMLLVITFAFAFKFTPLEIIFKIGFLLSLNLFGWWLVKKHVWKIKSVRKYFFNNMPDLNGRWEGLINREFEDNPHVFVLEIKQTLTDIQAFAYTSAGGGPSISISLLTDQMGDSFSLIYTWICETKNKIDGHTSGFFCGTSVLNILPSGKKIEGYYYTGRRPIQTRGYTFAEFKSKVLKGEF